MVSMNVLLQTEELAQPPEVVGVVANFSALLRNVSALKTANGEIRT